MSEFAFFLELIPAFFTQTFRVPVIPSRATLVRFIFIVVVCILRQLFMLLMMVMMLYHRLAVDHFSVYEGLLLLLVLLLLGLGRRRLELLLLWLQ